MSKAIMKTLSCSWDELETLPQETALEYADDVIEINGHTVYFVNRAEKRGYTALVYRSGKILPHAGDSALHYPDMYRANLREKFMQRLRSQLYTDEGLTAPLKDYEDYKNRLHYLHNHYGYQRPFITIFRKPVVRGSQEDLDGQRDFEQKTKDMIYDPVAFGFYAQEDRDFVERHCELYKAVKKLIDGKSEDYDFYFNAFCYEMANHEYPINWQGNYDVCSVFGPVEYDKENDDQNLTFYFDQLNFTQAQRRAYMAARNHIARTSDY